MIHVGVSAVANRITLERQAKKHGYNRKDIDEKLPEQNTCPVGSEDCISTVLDVDDIAENINQANIGVMACTSHNAGRLVT